MDGLSLNIGSKQNLLPAGAMVEEGRATKEGRSCLQKTRLNTSR